MQTKTQPKKAAHPWGDIEQLRKEWAESDRLWREHDQYQREHNMSDSAWKRREWRE